MNNNCIYSILIGYVQNTANNRESDAKRKRTASKVSIHKYVTPHLP